MNKIAILGFGVEGKSSYEYFKKLGPEYNIDVFDQRIIENDVVKITTVESFLDIDFSQYDVIVRSPSISPYSINQKIIADKKDNQDFELTSATQIFFDKCPAKIIGVTGTKGKGTTASFITSILHAAGRTAHLVGNIGRPALGELQNIKADDIVVYELSSFQLWDIKRRSPNIAVLTMIEQDHLDVHTDFDEYVFAKSNIVKFQTVDDLVVYNKNDQLVTQIALSSQGRKIEYPNQSVTNIADWVKLPGQYNVDNAIAAASAVWDIIDGDLDAIQKGIENFGGLPHRLKFVREVDGVKYYDNSIATTPGSAISTVKAFSESKILILGGSEKGADYTELGHELEENNVRAIYVIGEIRDRLVNQVSENYSGEIQKVDFTNMDDLVKKIAEDAESGEVVILAPAAASFGLFENYADRGERFVEAVNKL